jgi:hypothetical protein
MPQSQFLQLQDIVRAVAESESRRECADILCRVRSDLAEIRATTWEVIAKSRQLMADVDAAMSRRDVALPACRGDGAIINGWHAVTTKEE